MLDNCEHLLDAVVELVRELEESCPGVAVLSTSREGLGIAGERIVVVPSLTLPKSADRETVSNSDAGAPVDRAGSVGAVGLRVDRCERGGDHRGGATARRHPARVGARRGPHPDVGSGAARATSGSAVPRACRWAPGRHRTPRHASRRDRLVLRPVERRRTASTGAAFGVRRRLHPRSGRGGVFRRGHRRPRGLRPAHRARRSFTRGRRGRDASRTSLSAPGDDPTVRRRADQGGRACDAARPARRLLRRTRRGGRSRAARRRAAPLARKDRRGTREPPHCAGVVDGDRRRRARRSLPAGVARWSSQPARAGPAARRRGGVATSRHRDDRALPVRTGRGRCRRALPRPVRPHRSALRRRRRACGSAQRTSSPASRPSYGPTLSTAIPAVRSCSWSRRSIHIAAPAIRTCWRSRSARWLRTGPTTATRRARRSTRDESASRRPVSPAVPVSPAAHSPSSHWCSYTTNRSRAGR